MSTVCIRFAKKNKLLKTFQNLTIFVLDVGSYSKQCTDCPASKDIGSYLDKAKQIMINMIKKMVSSPYTLFIQSTNKCIIIIMIRILYFLDIHNTERRSCNSLLWQQL